MQRYNNANCAGTRFYRCLNICMQIGVSNPNVPIFPPRVCTLVLFIDSWFLFVTFPVGIAGTEKLDESPTELNNSPEDDASAESDGSYYFH